MFQPEDEGKTVVDSADRALGVVDEVVNGSAFVLPVESLEMTTRSALGWGGDDRSTFRLDDALVATRMNSEIILEETY